MSKGIGKYQKSVKSVRKVSEKCKKYQKSVKSVQVSKLCQKNVPRVYKAHFFDTRFSKRAGCRHFFYTLQGRTENQAHYFDTPFLHAEKTGHFVRHCSPTLFSKKIIKIQQIGCSGPGTSQIWSAACMNHARPQARRAGAERGRWSGRCAAWAA